MAYLKWWLLSSVLVGGVTVCLCVYYVSKLSPVVHAESGGAKGKDAETRMEVIHPQQGGMDRLTEQPGTVIAYESASLYSEVPGYLKTQQVDIGDRVKKGQVLAEIAVPELEKLAQRAVAALNQAKAQVNVMKAAIAVTRADLDVAKSGVVKAEASAKSAKAMRNYREKQLARIESLYKTQSIEERLVDETKEHAESAIEAERAARAAIVTSEAQVTASAAKIQKAEADLADAEAAVTAAQADLEKAQVMVKFATIVSPYDGIITQRNFFPGDFIRAATQGTTQPPLLTVEQTDKMRVVVQVPDRDAPFTDPGDGAVVELDALPGQRFNAAVSRLAGSEDPQTRLMRVEIDLKNPTGEIRQGMYGKVSITLQKSVDLLSVPSGCLVGKPDGGKGTLFVVRDGRLQRLAVRIGPDNGVRVAVLAGLTADDLVVFRPTAALREEQVVTPALRTEAEKKKSSDE